MEIWRSGPSGAKVTKSGWDANSSGSSLRFSAGQRLAPRHDFQVVRQAEVVPFDQLRVVQQAGAQPARQRGLADAFGTGKEQRLGQTVLRQHLFERLRDVRVPPEVLKHSG